MYNTESYRYILRKLKINGNPALQVSILPHKSKDVSYLLYTAIRFIQIPFDMKMTHAYMGMDETSLKNFLEDSEIQITFFILFFKDDDADMYINELKRRSLIY